MLGAGSTKPTDTAEERAKNIFNRFQKIIWEVLIDLVTRMDENNDGTLTEEEFLKGCLLVTNRKIFTFCTSSFPVSYQINTFHAWSLLKISRQLTFLTLTIPMITRTTSSPKCCVQMCLRSRCQTQLNTFLVWTLFFFYCCPSSDIYLPCLISIHHSVRVLLTLTRARKSKILGNCRIFWKLMESLKILWKP